MHSMRSAVKKVYVQRRSDPSQVRTFLLPRRVGRALVVVMATENEKYELSFGVFPVPVRVSGCQ